MGPVELSAAFFAELILRLLATGTLLLVITLLVRQRRENSNYLASAIFLFSIIGYLLAPITLLYPALAGLTFLTVLLANLVPPSFWYFTCTLFRDDFRAPPYSILLVVVSGALAMTAYVTGPRGHMNWLDWLSQGVKLLWVGAALIALVAEWRGDLVESRRRLRRIVVLLAGLYLCAIMVVELFLPDQPPALVEPLNVGLILVLVTTFSLHLLTLADANLLTRAGAPPPPPAEQPSAMAQQILQRMASERLYAREGLTLDALAGELDTQPHKLRQVINGELGQRNFNTFINTYRVQEVAQRLQQTEYRDTPLLTLALDAGFRSLAPFNRTFKAQFGQTPSAYRSGLD